MIGDGAAELATRTMLGSKMRAGSVRVVLGRGEQRLARFSRADRQNWVPLAEERWGSMQGQLSRLWPGERGCLQYPVDGRERQRDRDDER